MAVSLNADQKARLIDFVEPKPDFPLDRRGPEPSIDVAQRLLTAQYRINAWIENGVGHEQLFSLPDEVQAAFDAELAPQLVAKGFAVEYLDNTVKVRYDK